MMMEEMRSETRSQWRLMSTGDAVIDEDECYQQVVTVALCWQHGADDGRTDGKINTYLARKAGPAIISISSHSTVKMTSIFASCRHNVARL